MAKIFQNPSWTRDELILALDLYFRIDVLKTTKNHPEVIALSELLNKLPIHPIELRNEKFRNTNGVYTKLLNLVHVDPENPSNGLYRGSNMDKLVWDYFVSRRDELSAIAANIKSLEKNLDVSPIDNLDDEGFIEGGILERVHKIRERKPALVARKKKYVLSKTGSLACEVCNFDFVKVYGSIGTDFIECHHKIPLSESRGDVSNKLSDLAIVCANCHRMLHRGKPRPTIDELKDMIQSGN